MPRQSGVWWLLAVLVLVGVWFALRWWSLERGRGRLREMRPVDIVVGFVTNFFDALGIGNFAPTTAIFKLQQRMPDDEIPGTLNAGHALPTIVEAVIFVVIVTIELKTLLPMIAAAVAGAWLGAGRVARAPRRVIQLGMGI